jgi:ADP-dependent NAD(P)H-hydrate dehydratase / NAD(P)H-hydrate epimerase
MTTTLDPTTGLRLPAGDPAIFAADADLPMLTEYWGAQARLAPIGAAAMRGADIRAQRLGVTGDRLMEQAGAATAAAARALMLSGDRPAQSLVLILCGPGNNGGDGLVAARYLAAHGIASEVVLLANRKPETPDAVRNWDRLEGVDLVRRVSTVRATDMAIYLNGIERAGLIIDALLGTGVSGPLREPVRTAVDVAVRAREQLVPVLAVDAPTSLDLSTGDASDPVVRADATVTFHRPKKGLSMRAGPVLAGRVLVAPIGIPIDADRA